MTDEEGKLEEEMEAWRNFEPRNSRDILLFLQQNIENIQQYEQEKESLLTDAKVQRYEVLATLLEKYHSFLDRVEASYKEAFYEECNHDVWYLLYSETDEYEGRTYWNCKCLQCGKHKEARSNFFRNKVIMGECLFARAKRNEKPYGVVRDEYYSLVNKYDEYYNNKELDGDLYNVDAPVKTLIKRYK